MLMKPSKNAFVYTVRMLAANRGGSLRRANLTYHILITFFTCVVAATNTASPRDAVPAAGPLCTHGKDKPGLAP